MFANVLRGAVLELAPRPAFTSGVDTSILFVIAIALIFNSHLEDYYPYSWLAADGLFGNTMFFFLSGFAIAHGSTKSSLASYCFRRLKRIYPAAITALIIGLAISTIVLPSTIIGLFKLLIWPTPFTFVMLIVPFYFLLWFIKFPSVTVMYIVSGIILLSVSLLLDLNSGRFNGSFQSSDISSASFSAFFWLATASGAFLSQNNFKARFSTLRFGVAVLIVISYFLLKFAMIVTSDVAGAAAPLLLGLALAGVVASVFAIGDQGLSRRVLELPVIGIIVGIIANLTFEIYVGHSVILSASGLSDIIFPLNIVALILLTAVTALTLRIFTDKLG